MKKLGIAHAHLVADAAGADLISVTQQIADGRAELYLLGEVAVVLRVDVFPEGKELVIVCAQGEGLAKHMKRITDAAALIGAKSVRFHTDNPRLGEAARRWGYKEVQRVYQKVI